MLLTFVFVGFTAELTGVARTVLFIATPTPNLLIPTVDSVSFLSSCEAATCSMKFNMDFTF